MSLTHVWRAPRGLSLELTGGGAFIIAQVICSLGNLAFHVLATGALGPQSYGLLGSLLVVFAALAVPAGACGTILTAEIARSLERGEPVASRMAMRRSVIVGVILFGTLMAVKPVLESYLHMPSGWTFVWVGLYAVALVTGVVPWAVLCGHKKFASVGVAALGGVAVRFVLFTALVVAGWGVVGALAATVIAEAVRTCLMWRSAVRLVGSAEQAAAPPRLPGRRAVGGVVAVTGLWLLLGVDITLARHLFDPVVAGRYAATAMMAQLVFLLLSTVSVLAVPRFATADGPRLLKKMLVAGSVGALLVSCCMAAAAPWFEVLIDSAYEFDSSVALLLCLCSSGLGLLWILVQYDLARGRQRAPSAPWVGVMLALVFGIAWRPSGPAGPEGLAMVMLVAVGVVAALSIRPSWGRKREEGARKVVEPLRDHEVDLTVVVPFYNPGDRLRPNLLNLIEALRAADVTFEVITVEDGCTDGSQATIADLDPATVHRMSLPRNSGKGAALRLGLRAGRGRYIGFVDADGDLDPSHWGPFLGLVGLYAPDVIIGSKRHPLSEIGPGITWPRRMCSRGYQSLVRVLFPALPISDTQVGIKLFRRELLADVLPLTVERRFVFDLELLVVAWRRGYRRFMPAPVVLSRQGPSTIRVRTVWRMLADTLALGWRVHAQDVYAPGESKAPREIRSVQLSEAA